MKMDDGGTRVWICQLPPSFDTARRRIVSQIHKAMLDNDLSAALRWRMIFLVDRHPDQLFLYFVGSTPHRTGVNGIE
jgi:hypothetical protein